MRHFLIGTIFFFLLANMAFATAPGFYMGANVGQTNTHNIGRDVEIDDDGDTEFTKPSNTGVGGRIFMGGNFNQYFGIEGGFTHYAASTYAPSEWTFSPNNKPAIQENGFDFVGKLMYPFSSGIGVYVKGGVAVIRTTLAGSINPSGTSTGGTTNYTRPTAGLGLTYDITQNWVAEAMVSRVFKGGNFQNADFYGVGLSYHFVNKYCGQFLC